MIRNAFVTLACLVLVASSPHAGSIVGPLDEMIANSTQNEKIGAIIVMVDLVDNAVLNNQLRERKATLAERHLEVVTALQQKATETQGPILAALGQMEADGEVEKVRNFWISNMIAFRGTSEAIRAVAAMDGVDMVVFDFPVETIQPIKGGDLPIITYRPDGLDVIHAPEVWGMGFTGAGRLVSNIDTGVDGNHPALNARWRGNNGHPANQCWFDPVQNTNFPTDHGQHGTHTMGTICGRSTTTSDTVGVAINAQWIAAASVDYGGTTSDIIASFQFIADPDGNPGTTDDVPDACGNSWGYSPFFHGVPHCDQTFWTVIDGCEDAGVVVIFSAGNEGSYGANSLRTPADRATTYFNAFSVGAIDGHTPGYPIAGFSSLGPCSCASGDMAIKPECVAPGVNVYSSIPGGGYASDWSGTSMASPHITGSVAVLRQVNPNLAVDDIKNILMQSCVDLGPAGEDNTYGHGYLDLRTAVQLAMTGYGFVDGYIRDASNNNPLPGRVTVVGRANAANADALGYYILGLPADTSYTLRASYFGYNPLDHNVAVVANDTVSQNFLLSLAPSAALEGHVRDTSGTAIPGAIVRILDTPLVPDTTDANGFYRFPAVPVGSIYQVSATAPNYSVDQDSILIQNGTNTLDFVLFPVESFEFSNGGYSGSGVWQWGTPSGGSPSPHSGTKCWGTVLSGNYPDNVNDPLYSREFTIFSPDARLEFYHWYSTEDYYDGGNVSISTNNGVNWSLITPINGYPEDLCYALNEPGYSASSSGWQLAEFEIGSYIGQTVKFRFRFASDTYVNDLGWYIDDVAVSGTGTAQPSNIGYDPANFNVDIAPGQVETRPLNINNTGQGYLIFALSTVTNNILLGDGRQIPVKIEFDNPQPIGFIPADPSKPGAVEEPQYPPMILGQGGPDDFGHSWIDSDEPGGPPVSWVDISGPGTPVTLTDDSFVGPINIGFTFPFFENSYDQLFICSNGMLTFGAGSTAYVNTGIPDLSLPSNFLPIFWDDLNPDNGGTIRYYYDSSGSRFIVSYDHVPFFYSPGGTGDLNFQAILHPNGTVEYNYATMSQGNDLLTLSTIGIENAAGNDGLQVVFNGAYMHDNLSIRIVNSWLFASPANGIVAPGGNTTGTITFDASSLDLGTYTGNINLDSNDPDSPNIDIPVTLLVTGETIPDINPSAFSFTDTVFAGGTKARNLFIQNMGSATLFYGLHDNRAWIAVAPDTGFVPASQTDTVVVTFDATSLAPGTYSGQINLNSNDPDEGMIVLQVTLVVLDIGGNCVYIPGDINNNADVNGVDVSYGVNYFKGFGEAPPVNCPDCPSSGEQLYGAGDVNGNCQFNGVDISYFVNFLKGVGPELLFCPDCPPGQAAAVIPPKGISGTE